MRLRLALTSRAHHQRFTRPSIRVSLTLDFPRLGSALVLTFPFKTIQVAIQVPAPGWLQMLKRHESFLSGTLTRLPNGPLHFSRCHPNFTIRSDCWRVKAVD